MPNVFSSGSLESWNMKTSSPHVAMQIHYAQYSLLLSKLLTSFSLCHLCNIYLLSEM